MSRNCFVKLALMRVVHGETAAATQVRPQEAILKWTPAIFCIYAGALWVNDRCLLGIESADPDVLDRSAGSG